jgi:hypothetical protein
LDALHYAFRNVFGENVLVPLILDLRTGSGSSPSNSFYQQGRWAIEVADQFPTARVIGMDLALVQLKEVPPNCEFIVGDLTQNLDDFNCESVDFVHSRYAFQL